jgi:type III pantothenate kinase
VKVVVDNPREVGADRIVNTLAAHTRYGGPAIVIDFGTATTFDVVSPDGEYLGGAIAPGLVVASDALFRLTAQLRRIELVAPRSSIGKNTVHSMQSGVVWGYVGLVEGLVNRIKADMGEMGRDARVIATGGLARPDYVSVADPLTLQELDDSGQAWQALASLAVRIGKTRLIDNFILSGAHSTADKG